MRGRRVLRRFLRSFHQSSKLTLSDALRGGAAQYDADGAVARAYLVDTLGWDITDGGPNF